VVAGQAAVLLFLVYFLLASGDLFKRKFVNIAGPTLSRRRLTVQILDEINAQVSRFLLIHLFTSAIVALATGMILWSLGITQPAVWGILAGIFNTVPYFGPLVVAVGLGVVSFLQFGDLTSVLMVVGLTSLITSLEGLLLTPILMGRAARMNEVAIFVGLLLWGALWGVMGVFLAVPIMIVAKSIADRVEGLGYLAELLGEK
jgi:predicted PurR-regulated permease PerM